MSANEILLEDVVIKFAGDSGDGMQLTGSQFTNNTALLGIDLATFPDFPAEIRAPVGTVPGVSGYQLHTHNNLVLLTHDRLFAQPGSVDSLRKVITALKNNPKYVLETVDQYPRLKTL